MSGESAAPGHGRMVGRIATVGGFTLLSRVTGFVRDIVLAAVLGAGPVADAFFVAFRLPNHFRAIFAEGAFNAAFVPAYARIREQDGVPAVRLFADRIFALMLVTQLVLLAAAWVFMPTVVDLLAPGFAKDPGRFTLAVELTRITFPYLLMMTLVTLYGGILNALNRFAAAAGAPILLNFSMVAALALVAFFPTAGHAAAWGVLIAGVLQLMQLWTSTWRADALPTFRVPRWTPDIKKFFIALGFATIGSMGLQLALFADTIIASFLPAGALSALYYADRLNQLPIGVIGIAAGTVILPEMARRIAAGDEDGASHAQNRAMEFTLLLAVPCVAAFVLIPDLIMRALFTRGAFTAADAAAAGATLAAYTIGLVPFVLLRSTTATFFARGDTWTPVKAALAGAAVNVAFKIVFWRYTALSQVGLALATSIGAWINFALVLWFALRAGLFRVDERFKASLAKLAVAGVVMAAVLWIVYGPVLRFCTTLPHLRDETALAILAAIAGTVYVALILALFGRQLRTPLRRPAKSQDG